MWKEVKDFFSMLRQFSSPENPVTPTAAVETGVVADGLALAIRKIASIWGGRIGTIRGGTVIEIVKRVIVGSYEWAGHYILAYSAIRNIHTGRVYIEMGGPPDPPQEERALYRVLSDKELTDRKIDDYSDRMKNRHPEVFLLEGEDSKPIVKKIYLGESKQRMCFDLLRYGASKQSLKRAKHIYRVVYGNDIAFTNKSGYSDAFPRADFINGLDLNKDLIAFDKVRTCAHALISGTVTADGKRLLVDTLSMSGAPDIEYMKENPWLFFAAKNSGPTSTDWDQGDGEPVFIPFLSPRGVKVYYPLERLERVS